MQSIEEWRPVPGYVGLYEVSDEGRVRSLPRMTIGRNGRRHIVHGRILCLGTSHNGYKTAELSRDGAARKFRVNRLVAEAFIGPALPGLVACHNDGDRANNRAENLRWDTYQANSDDMDVHGTKQYGTANSQARLNPDSVREIRRLSAGGMQQKVIAARYGVNPATVALVLHGRTWTHVE